MKYIDIESASNSYDLDYGLPVDELPLSDGEKEWEYWPFLSEPCSRTYSEPTRSVCK